MIGTIIETGMTIIDKIFPDADEREKAKLELLKAQQEGKLKELEVGMSAIIAEAKSQDKWTSRARPSFMYIIYLFILASIPMGVLSVFEPEAASNLTVGVNAWLTSLPSELYWLFGSGYLGYGAYRSYDKRNINMNSINKN